MKQQVGVKLLIVLPDERVLLLRRSAKYGDIADDWDIPGGRIEVGEPLLEALARELREEIGWELSGHPELVNAQDIIREAKGIHVVRLTYLLRVPALDVTIDDEHTEYRFASKAERANMHLDEFLADTLTKLGL